jgi:signal transduction histidine kinase
MMWKWSLSAFNISRSAALTLAIVMTAAPVGALNPERGLAQYLRDEWGPSKGYTGGSVYGFAQTGDGFLWIAGENGVVRFDGLTFSPLAIPQSAAFEGPTVLGAAISDDGALWLRMRGRELVGYRDGAFVDEMAAHRQRAGTISAMSSQSDGGILIGGYSHGVIRFRQGRFEAVVPPQMMPGAPVISIAETLRGVWLGTRDAGLFRFGGALEHVDGLPADEKINCLLPDPSGDVWIGTDRGLARWTPRGIVRIALPDSRSVAVFSLLRDRESNIWVAAGARGVIRINTRGALSVRDWDARSNGVATALFEDRERNVWVGTTRGIVRMRDAVFSTYTGFANLPSDQIGAIHVDATGRTWFAPTRGGLYWLDGDRARAVTVAGLDGDVVYSLDGRGDELWIGRQYGGLTRIEQSGGRFVATRYTEAIGLAQNSVFAVHASADGTVWAGTLSGGVSHFHAGTFDTYTVRNGLASNSVTAIAESSDGDLWFGSPEGLTGYDGKRWRPYTTSDGLPSSNITALAADSAGTLWIGTASGLAVFRHGPGTVIEALPTVRDPIVGLAQDRSGWLWCATTDRLVRLSAAGDTRDYDAADGLLSRQGVNRHRTLIADLRGHIWYATNDGLSVADPAQFDAAAPSVPLRIYGVSVTRRRVVLSYAGVSLSVPERIRYRYHLDGFDREWSAPSTERTATYTNLAPAHYVFRVIASDGSGQGNGSEQSLAFDIQPLFWETMPFRFGALLVLIGAIWAGYRVRMAQVSRRLHVRFEERLAERNRIAQELHDTLLQGLLSASMQLHVATSRVPEDSPARSHLSYVLELMKRVIDEGRSAIRGLRSRGSIGDDLRIALAAAARDLSVDEAARIAVTVDGSPQMVHPFVRDEVYRVGREALVNAIRHAQARTIDVALDYRPDALVLTVSDDGIGIDEEVAAAGREDHWGLSGMRERAHSVGGRLSVRSRAGAGTEVELSIPGTVAYHESGRPPFRQ